MNNTNNTRWVKKIHTSLRKRGVVEESEFSFNSISNNAQYSFEERENIPLISISDIVPDTKGLIDRGMIADMFRGILVPHHPGETIDLAEYDEKHITDTLSIIKLYRPRKRPSKAEMEQAKLIEGMCEAWRIGEVTLRIELSRIVLQEPNVNLGHPFAINWAHLDFEGLTNRVLQEIYFGEDFSALGPFGFSYERRKNDSRSAEYQKKKQAIKAYRETLGNRAYELSIGRAIRNFVDLSSSLQQRCNGLKRHAIINPRNLM